MLALEPFLDLIGMKLLEVEFCWTSDLKFLKSEKDVDNRFFILTNLYLKIKKS